MKPVNVGSIVRNGILAISVFAVSGAPVAAQEGGSYTGPETRVTRLGGTTRFSPPMRNLDDLRSMVNTNRNELTRVFTMVDLASVSAPVLDALIAGDVTDTMVTPGTHLDWMALKRAGRPDVLRNVRWAGRNSFEAFQVKVTTGGYAYTFVVPKVCGNLSLVSRVAIPMTRAPEPPPPPPPPAPEPYVAAAPPPPPPAPVTQVIIPVVEERYNHWVASAVLGTSFAPSAETIFSNRDADNGAAATLSWGLTGGYVWKNVGVEGLLDFSPNIDVQSLFLDGSPNVSSYMANIVGAIPVGPNRMFQPYVSGGIGAIHMSADVLNIVLVPASITPVILEPGLGFTSASQTRFGGNIGVGASAFAGGRFGFRTDLRYFLANSDNRVDDNRLLDDLLDGIIDDVDLLDIPARERVTREIMSGLHYWRWNGGFTVRF